MPFDLFGLYKGYRAIPNTSSTFSSPSPSSPSSSRSRSGNVRVHLPEKPLHPGLYDPPPQSPSTSSTLCLPGSPRHGPLIDFDDGDDDQADRDTGSAADRIPWGYVSEESYQTVDPVSQHHQTENKLTNQEAALGKVRGRRGISPEGGYLSSYDAWCEELEGVFDVREHGAETRSELRFDEEEGAVAEVVFGSREVFDGSGVDGWEVVGRTAKGKSGHDDCCDDGFLGRTYRVAASHMEQTAPVCQVDGEKRKSVRRPL